MPKNMPKLHPQAKGGELVCGSCQWYNMDLTFVPDCRKTREVESSTPACTEHVRRMPDEFGSISHNDKYIVGMREILRKNMFKLDSSKFVTELQSYLNICKDMENINLGSTEDILTLRTALQNIISFRSRVSQITTSTMDQHYEMERVQREILLWLYSKYISFRELKNEGARKAALDRIIPELVTVQIGIDKVMDISKQIYDVLDKTDWTLRSAIGISEKLWFRESGPKNKSIV